MAGSIKRVKCPLCGKRVPWRYNPHRPFCSKECKLADLYNWLFEEYRIKLESERAERKFSSDS